MPSAAPVSRVTEDTKRQVLDLQEAADLLGVSTLTVRRYVHRKVNPLPCSCPGGKRWYFIADDVLAWLKSNPVNGHAPRVEIHRARRSGRA